MTAKEKAISLINELKQIKNLSYKIMKDDVLNNVAIQNAIKVTDNVIKALNMVVSNTISCDKNELQTELNFWVEVRNELKQIE